MKRTIAFTMKSARQLITGPYGFQRQQQVSQKMIPWVQSSNNCPNSIYANENWGEPASEEITKVVPFSFKETLSETALQNLLTKVTLPENYKFSPVKLVNSVAFASVPPSIKGADIKLQEVQHKRLLYKTFFPGC